MHKKIIVLACLVILLLSGCSTDDGKDTVLENTTTTKISPDDPAQEELEIDAEASDYNLYYGDWELTDTVFIEKEPVRGLIYSEEEIQERKKEILEKEIRSLSISKFSVICDQDASRQILRQQYLLFPAQDDYQLHFNLTLGDIGILQENADYFVYIQLEEEKQQIWELIIKDRDTLILCRDTYYVEYKRVSEDDLDFILFSG